MAKTKVVTGSKVARQPKKITRPSMPRVRTALVSREQASNVVPTFNYERPGDSVGAPYDNLLQAVELIRSGLPVSAVSRLAESSGLTLERIKQVARISAGSFARRKESGRLSPDESERLLRMGRIFERAADLYDGDRAGARQWLETPIPSLGSQRPLDLAQTDPGAREVDDLIGRIENGVVS